MPEDLFTNRPPSPAQGVKLDEITAAMKAASTVIESLPAGLGVNVNIYIGSFPETKPEPPKTCGSVGDMGEGVRGILICRRAPNHGGMHESNPGAFDAYRWSDEQVASRARGANV